MMSIIGTTLLARCKTQNLALEEVGSYQYKMEKGNHISYRMSTQKNIEKLGRSAEKP